MTMSELQSVMIPDGYSMKDFFAIHKDLEESFNRKTPSSYEVFTNQIDKDLNNVITITESGRQHHMQKGEEEITEHLISQLKHMYPSVHHDAQHGGHCDFYFETKGSDGSIYIWVMEAKLWDGFEYVYQGLQEQLLDSYAVGGENCCKGGMIFYSQIESGVSYAMDEWHKGLTTKGVIISDKRSDGLRFNTSHKLNQGIGADFYVNHYCIDLYHKPTAQKILRAKAKAEAKEKNDN